MRVLNEKPLSQINEELQAQRREQLEAGGIDIYMAVAGLFEELLEAQERITELEKQLRGGN